MVLWRRKRPEICPVFGGVKERVGRRSGRDREDWPLRRGEDGVRVGPDRKRIRCGIKVGDNDGVSGDIVGPDDAGRRRDLKIESRQCEVPRFTRTQHQPVRSKDHGGAIAIGGHVCDRDCRHAADLSGATG